MIRKLEGFNQHIVITGFSDVKIENVEDFFLAVKERTGNACVQFFNAMLVASWQHLYFAALNAVTAFNNKLNISENLRIEILLYASAQGQIKEAVRLIGIRSDCHKVAVVILANTREKADSLLRIVSAMLLGGVQDDALLTLTDEKVEGIKRLFEISETELEATLRKPKSEKEALVDLVIEHVALLATQR